MSFDYIRKIEKNIGIQLVKYYDFTLARWEEGMLIEKISNKNNIWKVLFPSTFTNEEYTLAISIKEGNPKKDYCAYKYKI